MMLICDQSYLDQDEVLTSLETSTENSDLTSSVGAFFLKSSRIWTARVVDPGEVCKDLTELAPGGQGCGGGRGAMRI